MCHFFVKKYRRIVSQNVSLFCKEVFDIVFLFVCFLRRRIGGHGIQDIRPVPQIRDLRVGDARLIGRGCSVGGA